MTPCNNACFRCILATDMARHNEIVTAFKAIDTFDIESADHRLLVSASRFDLFILPERGKTVSSDSNPDLPKG